MSIASSVVKCAVALLVAAGFVLATSSDASASDHTRTYSFGPGTGSNTTREIFKEFSIPCGTPGAMTVTVSFKRSGPVDQTRSFALEFEIHEPAAPGEAAGAIAGGAAYGAIVHTTEGVVTRHVQPTSGGCSRPWVVQVRSRDGDAPYVVSGSMTLRFGGETRDLNVSLTPDRIGAMSDLNLSPGESKTLLIEGATGCGQGRMAITGTWFHQIGNVRGNLPVRMQFELLNDAFAPPGTAVAVASGYSNNEPNGSLTKLSLVHRIPICKAGQWRLKITNVDQHPALLKSPSARLTPTCP